MQHSQMELRAQQIVLAFLGFYKGPVDGIWSSDSIAAKRRFEFDDKFIPAAPNNGLPFALRQKLPKGLVWDQNGMLTHRDLTPEKIKEIMERQQKKKVEQPVAKEAEPVVEAKPDNGAKKNEKA